MVSCNICGCSKTLEELQCSFRYVCKKCWDKIKITLPLEDGKKVVLDKDLFY